MKQLLTKTKQVKVLATREGFSLDIQQLPVQSEVEEKTSFTASTKLSRYLELNPMK